MTRGTYEATAPAKLVLLGEYAVLEGAPAIVAAVNRLVRVTFTPGPDAGWDVHTDLDGGAHATLSIGPDGLAFETPWLAPVAAVLEGVARTHGIALSDVPGGAFRIESGALYVDAGETKLGLGSSAAVVTALHAVITRALADADLASRDEPGLDALLALHRSVQGGAGSGIDVAASLRGGVLRYQLLAGRPQAERLSLPPQLEMGVVWTGVPASTPTLVAGVRAWKLAAPEAFDALLATMRTTTAAGVAACESGDGAAFLACVEDYRDAMAALGEGAGLPILSPEHRALAALAAEAGVAYKPSGAGGGDVGLLFAPSQTALLQAGRAAEAAGYRLLDLGVHPEGVQLRYHERTSP